MNRIDKKIKMLFNTTYNTEELTCNITKTNCLSKKKQCYKCQEIKQVIYEIQTLPRRITFSNEYIFYNHYKNNFLLYLVLEYLKLLVLDKKISEHKFHELEFRIFSLEYLKRHYERIKKIDNEVTMYDKQL